MKKVILYVLAVVSLIGCASSGKMVYDERPKNAPGILTKGIIGNYDVQNAYNFPRYKRPFTIEVPDGVNFNHKWYQLYRTKDATYLTVTYHQPGYRRFYIFPSNGMLVDSDTGDRYMLRKLEHYPLDTCFWLRDLEQPYVRLVFVFPPLADNVKNVDILFPTGPSRSDLSGRAEHYANIPIKKLRPKKKGNGRIIR